MNYFLMTLCEACAKLSLFETALIGAAKKKTCDVCGKRKLVMLYRVSRKKLNNEEEHLG